MDASRKPVVGVVGHGHQVPRDFGILSVTGTPPTYLDAIAAAGGRPVILSPGHALDVLDLVDALVLTGGGDIDPVRYGGSGPADGVDPARDEAEIALVHAAAEAQLPVLGVCRGMQVLAVAFGGSLHNIEDHRLPHGGHEVSTAPGSLIHELLGPRAQTSALHRQAVLDPGPHWRATAWADDGTVEAIEPATPGRPVLGVQWHPELSEPPALGDSTGPALFGWLTSHHRKEPSWKPSTQSA